MKRKAKVSVDVLLAIEEIAGDDFCEDLAMCQAAAGRYKLRGRIATAYEKLSAIYQLAHGFNPNHPCHKSHADWRKPGYRGKQRAQKQVGQSRNQQESRGEFKQ